MKALNLADAYIIEMPVYGDNRGFFTESYNRKSFEELGLSFDFVQDNHSRSCQAGVLRGLHFQKGDYAQTKLLRVTKGAIYDVIVDLRASSKTFGQWQGVILSESNHRQLLVPKGFAHGFVTLVDDVDVQYKVDAFYHPEADSGIAFDSQELGIDWPVDMDRVILSEKDKQHEPFDPKKHYFD
ncbi:dTDP-4-dehydrorhamnose 3,5-epimerase [Atopobacter sp. AH10]|uniref:dTDP-4-dehydrorhamnose 3,5-epimerase n=1 Tax=Atopobacter sp. AH10 TaxID=2315861 RepID=UPI000EF1DDAC|nr:dTDP-4-dehydrorhamnose 3,5-epimerase [Atopobacter sp. AH10]RLK63702.1 dTDP-4-dehydrorhamnose 3,5-epimerase [Atopobacter sp. AH10]